MPYGYIVSRWGHLTLAVIGARPFTSYSAAGSVQVLGCAVQAMPARLGLLLAAEVSVPIPPYRAVRAPSVHALSRPNRWDSS